ncbi:hypothetical protein acsn021_06240 [Anaerocolumna cellulosilytica]|uniref:Uncharacterized protein n=2 Tax=Anaerocolumna cellulosilytica TaxID=433286 RepID=A0A6S6R0B4_9FIRM|nr:hypothetical protein [Anaerocolumna cellulosilytica]BCJ93055.1 hypothetical protein acsn021_06240 [Anaerocolumna cellulosilytica]
MDADSPSIFDKRGLCNIEIIEKKTSAILFSGYSETIKYIVNNGLHKAQIHLISYSARFDCKLSSRSFQDVSGSLQKIASFVAGEYTGASVVFREQGSKAIGYPIFQYDETDWEFLKRIASRCHQVLIADSSSSNPSVYIGADTGSAYDLQCAAYEYSVADAFYKMGRVSSNYSQEQFKCHKIRYYKNLPLGKLVRIKEGTYYIIEKHASMNHSEVVFEYTLGSKSMLSTDVVYNQNLCGLQLQGTVTAVMEDKVKVKLAIDKKESGAYAFDWYPEVSNIMYCMPEIGERVNLYLYDGKGGGAAVVNCLRSNGSTCANTSNPAHKIFEYKNKSYKMLPEDMTFEIADGDGSQQLLALKDMEGIVEDILKTSKLSAKKKINLNTPNGKINIQAPSQIEIRQSDSTGATLSINQTIECDGKTVDVQASLRIEYPAFDDAPVAVKKSLKKILFKILAAVVIVAAVALVAAGIAALTVATGGMAVAIGAAAIKAAVFVVSTALIGGAVTAGISIGVQWSSDKKNGIKRGFLDYLYLGVDKFCTGAIISAPMGLPNIPLLPLVAKLAGVAGASYAYQKVDNILDAKFGRDYYDEDSNMTLNIAFDIFFAGLGEGITSALKTLFGKGLQTLSNLKLSKADTKALTKLWNTIPFVKKLSTSGADVNINKHYIREVLTKILPQKLDDSNIIWYLILGGREATETTSAIPGADIPTSLFTDSDVNPLFGKPVEWIEDIFKDESEYDSSYTDYSVLMKNDEDIKWIDIDENGNLVFE